MPLTSKSPGSNAPATSATPPTTPEKGSRLGKSVKAGIRRLRTVSSGHLLSPSHLRRRSLGNVSLASSTGAPTQPSAATKDRRRGSFSSGDSTSQGSDSHHLSASPRKLKKTHLLPQDGLDHDDSQHTRSDSFASTASAASTAPSNHASPAGDNRGTLPGEEGANEFTMEPVEESPSEALDPDSVEAVERESAGGRAPNIITVAALHVVSELTSGSPEGIPIAASMSVVGATTSELADASPPPIDLHPSAAAATVVEVPIDAIPSQSNNFIPSEPSLLDETEHLVPVEKIDPVSAPAVASHEVTEASSVPHNASTSSVPALQGAAPLPVEPIIATVEKPPASCPADIVPGTLLTPVVSNTQPELNESTPVLAKPASQPGHDFVVVTMSEVADARLELPTEKSTPVVAEDVLPGAREPLQGAPISAVCNGVVPKSTVVEKDEVPAAHTADFVPTAAVVDVERKDDSGNEDEDDESIEMGLPELASATVLFSKLVKLPKTVFGLPQTMWGYATWVVRPQQ
ncbi:hypothetical protein FISHEDRAFT_72209 [Fistulina hepatica ATCC 64428]|uniref:Uncharacterized protein n=1 Tax=Fistulina hepatica ATCC 64428 TaxID=1128425 RepID=A0A0D7AGL3_9AGAR|nr:hypothetical protein FISHEDRAFT_72209 [Fistulina hepatica ATCC 64428]